MYVSARFPGDGSGPFSAGQVFWLNLPAVVFCFMSICGSFFIISCYLYTEKMKTLGNKLVAWLSFSDFILCTTMFISIITAMTQGQVAFLYAMDWYPIIQITNFFICAGWLWSAVIAFASLNMASFTITKEREEQVMKNIHLFVWTSAFTFTMILTIFNGAGKATWSLRFQALSGLFIYVWNVVLFIFVMVRISTVTKEMSFIEETKQVRQKMISLVWYLIPFVLCWSVFVVCGMISFESSFAGSPTQFGFWTLMFMICLPPLQGTCNAVAFGLTSFKGPRLLLERLLFKDLPISEQFSTTEETLPINYDSDSDASERNFAAARRHRSRPPSLRAGSIPVATPTHAQAEAQAHAQAQAQGDKQARESSQVPVVASPPAQVAGASPALQFRISVYMVYFNSFLYYFSLGMKLMVKWTYIEALHGTLAQFGWTMAAFGIGWFVTAIPCAMWARRFNTRQVLFGTTALSLLASILWAFAKNPSWLIVSRLLSGMAAGNITVGRAFLAAVSTPETRTIIMANSSAASMLGSVLGPALSLVLSFSHQKEYHVGKLLLRFDQYTYPGWVIMFTCIIFMILLALFFEEPNKANSPPVITPKLSIPIVLCGLQVFVTLCMLSFFETLSLPVMIIIFNWSVAEACGMWIFFGMGSFFVQLGVIRVMNQTLKIEDRFGIFLGLCIGLFGTLVLTGYSWRCNIASLSIGGVAIVSISGAFLFTFSLALLSKFLGRATIYYMGHVFTAGALGRIIGPLWAVAATTKFSMIGLSLDGIQATDMNSLLPFAGCSVVLLISLILLSMNYKKMTPS